jgi:hypothetical protein
MNWKIHQMDVKIALKNEILEVEIDQLEGFVHKGKKYFVCKLKKNLFRLKQSPRTWYHYIDSFFINEGFCRSQADLRYTSNKWMIICWWQSST